MANAEELTSFAGGTLTLAELETLIEANTVAVADVDASTFASPAPIDLSDINIDKKAVTQTVSTTSISSAQDMAAAGSVTYTQISTSDEITNETLNKTAETLKTSINAVLAGIDGKVESTINQLASETRTAITTLKDGTNTAFVNVKTQIDDQVTEIENKIDNAVEEINDALDIVRTKNVEQNQNIATAINTTKASIGANIAVLKTAIDELALKQQALDDVYLTDSDMAERITAVNDLLDTLREADVDVVAAIGGTVTEVNSLLRVNKKRVTMNTANGMYSFNLLAEGYPEFDAVSKFSVEAEVIGEPKAQVSVTNKVAAAGTGGAVDLEVKSNGVHFVPQPVDGSVTPITLLVTVSFDKVNPLTFNIDQLDDAWLTSGNGTDNTTVPAV